MWALAVPRKYSQIIWLNFPCEYWRGYTFMNPAIFLDKLYFSISIVLKIQIQSHGVTGDNPISVHALSSVTTT